MFSRLNPYTCGCVCVSKKGNSDFDKLEGTNIIELYQNVKCTLNL